MNFKLTPLRNILIPWIFLTEYALLISSQGNDDCFTTTTLEPVFVSVGTTKRLKIRCKASTVLRLQFDKNPLMFIQKFTSFGPVTMATLDGNDTVTKHVGNIDVIGFFPTNFQVIIANPNCSDISTYGCGVNVTNSSCTASRRVGKLARNGIAGTDGSPSLTLNPQKKYYTEGETVVLVCSTAFYSSRRFLAWNWFHPTGKSFPKVSSSQRFDNTGNTCNRTSSVTLTLEADDNGARVVCMTGNSNSFRATVTLRVAARGNTPVPSGSDMATDPPPYDCVPGYSLGLVAVFVLLLSVGVYTALLLAGGTKLRFPSKCCCLKDSVYDIPDRGSSVEIENRYYSLKGVQPIYVNQPDPQQRDYEDVNNIQ